MEHPANAIARDLAGQAERLCRRYLSNGRREGNYWQVGDVRNTPGRSLYVRLRDSPDGTGRAGKWTDAESGEHGDLLDIIRASTLTGTLSEALAEARRFLSLPDPPDSRFAAGVAPARAWLAERRVDRVSIIWREDVRVWHPGQAWIWEPGGLGVFDPGINALSIATHILPRPFFLKAATLTIPANRAAPIAAEIEFRDTGGAPILMDLDWRQTGPQSWDIIVETDAGTLKLSNGGAVLALPTGTDHSEDREYPGLYARFATLIQGGRSDVDTDPLRLVADAFLRGRRETSEAFYD